MEEALKSILKIVAAVLVPTCVMGAFAVLISIRNKKTEKMTDDNFTVQLPGMVAVIGAISTLMCAILIIGFTVSSGGKPSVYVYVVFYAVFALFIWGGLHLVLKTAFFRVRVNGDQLAVSDVLKRSYTFTFGEIISVKRQVKKNRVKSERLVIRISNGKKLIVESAEIGYKILAKRIQLEVDSELLTGF